jgi:hypothetical protein
MSEGIEPKTAGPDQAGIEKGAVPASHDSAALSKNLEAK